jgi:hypothetical protein
MAKLELGELTPYENSKGKYLEVMGVTSTEIVVIGSGGKTAAIPLSVQPNATAKDLIYLTADNEITDVEKFEKQIKEAVAKAGSQQNSHKGSIRSADNAHATRSV